jgi:16S rRNA C967 or C1407 C5-methylase (RsmB/RsmF family)
MSKMLLQRRLYDLRSAVIFNHDYQDFANSGSEVGDFITKEEYDNGRVMVEVRNADEELVKPLHQEGDIGLEYNGKRYLVNLVYRMVDKDGREKIIDLAALNNPATLRTNLSKIKDNLLEKRETADTIEKRNFFDNLLKTIDSQVALYE